MGQNIVNETELYTWYPIAVIPPQIESTSSQKLLIQMIDERSTASGFYEPSTGKYFTYVQRYDQSSGDLPLPVTAEEANTRLQWVVREAHNAMYWMIVDSPSKH